MINKEKIIELLPKIGKIAEITIVSLILLALIIKIFVRDPDYYKDNKKEQKKIQLKVDSLYNNQDSLKLKLESLEKGQIMFYDIIAQTNESLNNNNKKLDNLRRLYNEKIKNVDHFNISDLDSFFRSKYARYYQEEKN